LFFILFFSKRHFYSTSLTATQVEALTAPIKVQYQLSAAKSAINGKAKGKVNGKGKRSAAAAGAAADAGGAADPFAHLPNLVTEGQVLGGDAPNGSVGGSNGQERTVVTVAPLGVADGGASAGGSKGTAAGKKGKKGDAASSAALSLVASGVKEVVANRWLEVTSARNSKGGEDEDEDEDPEDEECDACGMTPLQSGLFRIINGYHDTLFTAQTLEKGWEDQAREVTALHVLNHAQKARDRWG
jgi:hypothetical protein